MEPSWTITSSDDVAIAGYELGGTGDILLISHATGLCGPMYRQLAAQLTATFRVVAFDYRGHGMSSTPAGSGALDWEHMADDTAAVRAVLGDGPVHAFGHSMGGACLLLAELANPGSFTSLYLFEPIVVTEQSALAQVPLAESALRRRPEFASHADVLARYAAKPPYNAILAGVLADYVEHGFAEQPDGTVRLRCAPQTESTVFANGMRNTIPGLESVTVPTIVAMGRPGGPADLSVRVAERMPNGTLVAYEHLDHFGPFQDPYTLGQAITRHARGT